ncbi:peptide chain release factor N(5)-glutamine methyltransferase [Olleya sp. AS48]|uniref:peptide chain release factor N(5)-glutamine methyltransferase n=1 Tax=Olleya sp. AS48 TaxID=3135774 RepID=UPI00316EC527
MLIKDLKALFHKELDDIYGPDEVFTFFFMLTEHYCNISRLDVALNTNLSVTTDEKIQIFKALESLEQQQPIQYILGETEFFGMPFKVNPNTLIPRPETEELVQLVLDSYDNKEQGHNASVLDIGTGSGCIAISLAKNLAEATIFGLDVSAKAIKIATQNALLNKVNVDFIEASILEDTACKNIFKDLKFDTIVSNPPYVRQLEKQAMTSNVLDNEPHLALFVSDDNPLIFYKAITKFASQYLKTNGELFFEINEYLGKEMIALLIDNGFKNVQLKQDFFGKDRMISGVKQ